MSISGLGGASQSYRSSFQPPSFGSLDTNSDNSVSLDELTAGAPEGASAGSDGQMQALFSAMDTDGNGSVSQDEKSSFDQKLQDRQSGMAFLVQQLNSSNSSSNGAVFAATDTDGNGSVSFEEFTSDDAANDIDSDSLQKIFDMIDADGDGSISETESSDFLDEVKTALADQGPPPPGGMPPSSDDDDSSSSSSSGSSSSIDLFTIAYNAYSQSSSSSDLLSQLESLLKAA